MVKKVENATLKKLKQSYMKEEIKPMSRKLANKLKKVALEIYHDNKRKAHGRDKGLPLCGW